MIRWIKSLLWLPVSWSLCNICIRHICSQNLFRQRRFPGAKLHCSRGLLFVRDETDALQSPGRRELQQNLWQRGHGEKERLCCCLFMVRIGQMAGWYLECVEYRRGGGSTLHGGFRRRDGFFDDGRLNLLKPCTNYILNPISKPKQKGLHSMGCTPSCGWIRTLRDPPNLLPSLCDALFVVENIA